MEIEERKVDAAELRIGMYVSRLDRPWIETPFFFQGFLIRTDEEIERIREHCSYVFVDVAKGIAPANGAAVVRRPTYGQDAERLRDSVKYRDTATLAEEMPRAREAHQKASVLTGKILADVRAGRKLSIEDVNDTVEPVVESILRSTDAFFWITSLKQRDAYVYSHAINCSALGAAFGRHLGFPEDVLVTLASGGLLLDLGKAKMPDDLLLRAGPLDEAEHRVMQGHVEAGIELLERSDAANQDIVEMIMTHHERHDGTGYPHGLAGSRIPMFGRMMGLIDCYDAMTSDRVYAQAMARHQVLQTLYSWRDTLFQAELVEQFMQTLGVYPTGSLVELTTGEVAIVMAQNQARRLRPRVMLLMSPEKTLYDRFPEVDLMAQPDSMDVAKQVDILKTLDPGAYGLDPAELYL